MMILIGDGVVMDVIEMMVDKQADLHTHTHTHTQTRTHTQSSLVPLKNVN